MLVSTPTLRPNTQGPIAAATTEYGTSYEDLKVSGAASATSASELVASAADFVVAGVVAGDIVKNTTDGTFALVVSVDDANILTLSADIFEDTEEFEVYSNHGYKINDLYKELAVILNIFEAADAADDTLDVFVDTSFDDGETWLNLGRFTQAVGNGGAKTFVMSLIPDNPGGTAVFDASADQDAGDTLQCGFGQRIRYRAAVASGTAAEFDFTLKAHLRK